MKTLVVSNSIVLGDNSIVISAKDVEDALDHQKGLVLKWNGECMTIPYQDLQVIGQTVYKIKWTPDPKGEQGRYRQLSLFNLDQK